jgi:hypothetical protein
MTLTIMAALYAPGITGAGDGMAQNSGEMPAQ